MVENALLVSSDNDKADLIELKQKLEEVIQLSKESLASTQKHDLPIVNLAISDSHRTNESRIEDDLDAEFARFQKEMAEISNVNPNNESLGEEYEKQNSLTESPSNSALDDTLADTLASLEGSKCQAPFSREWGELSYYNALIFSVEVQDELKSLEDLKVKVMFCNPVCESIKPCPFYLEGHCKFYDENCRYSHGELVNFEDLREFSEPDYSILQQDVKCLAKYSDGIWYRAVVEKCLDNHRFLVKYERYGNSEEIELEDIFPIASSEHSFASNSDNEDDDTLQRNNVNDENDDVPTILWVPSDPTARSLGEWEKHTKGIGSKIMAQMGYIWGQGLGKNGEGRMEPIEAVILPQGKSLDKCMELRENAAGLNPMTVEKKFRKSQRKFQSKLLSGYLKTEPKKTVFDFINKKISNKKDEIRLTDPCDAQKLETPVHNFKCSSNKGLNEQSLRISLDIQKAEKELEHLQNSLIRNKDKDKVMQSQLEQRIKTQKQIVQQYRSKDHAIQKEKQLRKNKYKLSVF